MAVGNKLVDRAKAALRISSNNEAIVGEIKDILEENFHHLHGENCKNTNQKL